MYFYGCLITVVTVASPADKDAISEQHTAFVTVPMSPGYLLWKVVKENTAKLLILCCLYLQSQVVAPWLIKHLSSLTAQGPISLTQNIHGFLLCFSFYILLYPIYSFFFFLLTLPGTGHVYFAYNYRNEWCFCVSVRVHMHAHVCVCVCMMEVTGSPLVTKHSVVFLPDIRHSEKGTLSWKGSLNRSET